MKNNKAKMGSGLDALFTSNQNDSTQDQNNILISRIVPNPNQPRKIFDQKSLNELANSIAEKGLISPITVKPEGSKFIVIAGERRLRAHQLLGKKKILCYVVDEEKSNEDVMFMALIENIQRDDLNAIEEAKAYKYLQSKFSLNITDIAKTVGKSRPAVSNSLRLLNLPDPIQESILEGNISAGQARAILQKKTSQGMILIWQKILKENLSVRKVEKAVSSPKRQNKILNRLELEISQKIGTKVEISSNRSSKGNVKIYFDKVTFDRVVEKLKSIKSD